MTRLLFLPAIALMNRLKFTAKFAVLGLMSLFAITVVVYSLYVSLDQVIRTARLELEGRSLLSPVNRAVRLIQQHRGLSGAVLAGQESMGDARAAKALETAAAFSAMEAQLPLHLRTNEHFQNIRSGWERLRAEGPSLTVAANFAEHTRLIEQLLMLLASIADDYALILDPDIDAYYLIDTSANKLPQAIEHIGQIRAFGSGILAAKRVSMDEKIRLYGLMGGLDDALKFLTLNLEKSGRYNPAIQDRLSALSREINDSARRIADRARADILQAQFAMTPEDFFTSTTADMDRLYDSLDVVLLPAIDTLLNARIERAAIILRVSVGGAVLLFLLAAYFSAGIYLATIGSIRTLARSARAFADGDLQRRIQLGTRDELNEVGGSFNEMAREFAVLLATHQEDEARFRLVLETALDAVVLMNEQGIVTGWNRQAEKTFGRAREEAIGQVLHEMIVPPRYREAHVKGLQSFLDTGAGRIMNIRMEFTGLHAQGHEFPIELAIVPRKLSHGFEFSAFIRDITARKQAEESLRLAALVYENSSEAMIVTQADGTILAVNPAFTRTTGYAADEVIGQNPRILSSGRHDAAFYQALWESINISGHWQGEIWNRRKSGEIYIEELSINTIFNEDGAPWRRVALFSDITQKKASEEQLWKQANFDPLTGLPNRRMFLDRLEQEIKKSHRANLPLGLLLLDLDHFKEVNDTLGHHMGDVLLQETAQRISGCVRETDTVARLGGDEFTIILGEMESPENLERIAQNILDSLAESFRLGEEMAYVSASIGITLYPTDGSDMEQLIKNADQAMYAAKHQGRNRYSYFLPSMQEAAQYRLRLANDLRNALPLQQFQVHYQPIVELASGAVHKAEALIRWNHHTRGLVSPGEFIPIAEDTGLIVDIGDWVFRTAAEQVRHWRATYHAAFQVGVNKSPLQFRTARSGYPPWSTYLQTLGLSGDSLVAEITEGLLMDGTMATNDKLLELRDAGIQVAIDDFGTGYSSLAYLKKFDIDYLKIDQSFTRNLAPESGDLALCEAIVVMAHKLGLKVIAEGVETEDQRDLLVATGCDYAQGYLFAKPMPPEVFDAWMKGQRSERVAAAVSGTATRA